MLAKVDCDREGSLYLYANILSLCKHYFNICFLGESV